MTVYTQAAYCRIAYRPGESFAGGRCVLKLDERSMHQARDKRDPVTLSFATHQCMFSVHKVVAMDSLGALETRKKY